MAVRILVSDVMDGLAALGDDSVDCVVTSPPYWGLRDYGVEGQLGLEPTLAEHIAAMVAVFEEVRRVLKPTGTLWLNYGDCYASTPNGRSAADTKAAGTDDRTFRDKPFSTVQGVLKAKDLCMIPNRLAITLQEAGWWVRSEIIWLSQDISFSPQCLGLGVGPGAGSGCKKPELEWRPDLSSRELALCMGESCQS